MGGMLTIVPISELRQDASAIIKQASASGEPVFITQHGRASAILMSAGAYEQTQRESAMLKVLAQGEADIAEGKEVGFDAVMTAADELLNKL